MAHSPMPNVRDLSGLTANSIMLASIGALLRIEYIPIVEEALPAHLNEIAGRLAVQS